jgi:hypothetical protein
MRLGPDDIEVLSKLPRWEEFRELAGKVRKHAEDLARVGVVLDDGSMLIERMESILDAVLPKHSAERLDFEIEWQKKIAESLKEGEGAYHTARLRGMAGPRATSSGIVLPT